MEKIQKTCIAILFCLLLFSVSTIASGKEIYVDKDGTGDFTNIQEAIDAAEEHDIIVVYPGTYLENLIVNKSIYLMGYGKNVTKIHGMHEPEVITISSRGITIRGFTIQNGGIYSNDTGIAIYSDYQVICDNIITDTQHGIYLKNSSHVDILENIITDNMYGILLDGNSSQNNIYNNTVSYNDYGIYIKKLYAGYPSPENNIFDNDFSNNDYDSYDEFNPPTPTSQEPKTPGFELILVFCSLALLLFWKKKKQN